MDELNIDFRLVDVTFELFALADHLDLLENQIENFRREERTALEKFIRKENLFPEDPEWHEATQDFNRRFDFLLPRAFRGPFLVSVYAVYESSVIEISRMIQTAKAVDVSISGCNYRGSKIDRLKKYFSNNLQFELCPDNGVWQRIKMLAELRHAYAHANGRLELLSDESQGKIRKWEKQKIGIENYQGYLVVSAGLTREIFDVVRLSMEELVERYKDWDLKRNNKP